MGPQNLFIQKFFALFVFHFLLVQGTAFGQEALSPKAAAAKNLLSTTAPKNFQVIRSGYAHDRGCYREEFVLKSEDPVDKLTRSIKVTSWKSYGAGSRKNAVILVPTIIGPTSLEYVYAADFCQAGIRIVLVQKIDRTSTQAIEFESYDQETLRRVSAIREIASFLQKTGSKKIGIMGTSAGAIVSSLVLAMDNRIKVAALLAGGAGFADIVAGSIEDSQDALRIKRFKKFGFRSIKEYRDKLEQAIIIDNTDILKTVRGKRIWMMIALNDNTVPTKNQILFKKLLKPVDGFEHPGDHLESIIQTNIWNRNEILDFFLHEFEMNLEENSLS